MIQDLTVLYVDIWAAHCVMDDEWGTNDGGRMDPVVIGGMPYGVLPKKYSKQQQFQLVIITEFQQQKEKNT